MKILEAQSAVLTNYEVYCHLVEQEERYERRKNERIERLKEKKGKGGKLVKFDPSDRRPGNLATLSIELLEYLRAPPSPLGSSPLPYDQGTIKRLLEGLRPWDFTKGEIIMILNLRPTTAANLNTIVEEMVDRFPDEADQEAILNVIIDVLGQPDQKAEREAMDESKDKNKQAEEAHEAAKDEMDVGE
ncbi:HRDC-like protein [Glarea lozoyensis ATCC 20868]|uniref:DNA-directed RNA polymerase III subunit RPC9 n=1 Tax=Glarea lozoyensis (strain ATCC 20868 / MF5171) TaxID=1116229 RepID=S3CUT5_GLAL2|nr:HRDC-like protein [Glarea lozoyensis ATCC 20868]EPE29400.1 HRDC-like protein [Glarea lozoyensis ATCC 20868]